MIQSGYLFKVDLHGRNYQPASVGNLYSGGNQAAVATAFSAGLPTTYTGGLVLANPINSTVNLAIVAVSASFVVAQTNAAVIGLGVAHSTSALSGTLTVVPSQNQLVGSSKTAQGKLYSSASVTLPTAPYLARILKTVDTGALTVQTSFGGEQIDLGSGIILPPGGYAVFTSSAAGTASSFIGGFVWEEIAAA